MSLSGSTSTTPSSPAFAAITSTILTPSKKVQALLAQFSDSETDENQQSTPERITKIRKTYPVPVEDQSESGEEEDAVIQPRGRLAARLLGGKTALQTSIEVENPSDTRELIANSVSSPQYAANQTHSQGRVDATEIGITVTTSDQQQRAGLQTVSPGKDAQTPVRASQSESPLFFPSPSGLHANLLLGDSPRQASTPNTPARSGDNVKSKFFALVEKHRKERLAREAAEVAKRASRVENDDYPIQKRVRGSSPADDSSEDSASGDDEAIKRIQKQARPTRKASKKALEEMNRETQRMNRNMQLAHQARTKRKVTKESLLARFNFMSGDSARGNGEMHVEEGTGSSSAAASDTEHTKSRSSSPATSPIRETEGNVLKLVVPHGKETSSHLNTGQVSTGLHSASMLDGDILTLGSPASKDPTCAGAQVTLSSRCNGSNADKSTRVTTSVQAFCGNPPVSVTATRSAMQTTRVNFARIAIAQGPGSDSDGEIEIIKEQGLKRKYAAFETIPKRKAKEMPSHLALRSLAHIIGNDDKNRSINAAELEAGLRRRARLQALEERRQRIEELKAKGIVIQTTEEREKDQQEVEDLVERARKEAVEIQKREKDLAKKDGTYVKDKLDDDDDDDSEDSDFEEELVDDQGSESEQSDGDHNDKVVDAEQSLIDDEGAEADLSDEEASSDEGTDLEQTDAEPELGNPSPVRTGVRLIRKARVISDDEDEEVKPSSKGNERSPQLPLSTKTPLSVPRSARKVIPGLQMSDDLPMGLSQAFAATMAESQTQESGRALEQLSLDLTADLPMPGLVSMPLLHRFDSIELINDSQPSASQTQPLNISLISQSQVVPDSSHDLDIQGPQYTPSQRQLPFELTQDNGYILSPFSGNRFAETPSRDGLQSTVETVILPQSVNSSPTTRRGRLQRGRARIEDHTDNVTPEPSTAFQFMHRAAKAKAIQDNFDKKKSNARNIVDEAAEESEDEYAGLGGASDDSGDDEENEDDRRLIDQDTQVGRGDEAKLAGLYADRERERDEKEVSKLLKDITTGALRRKRGIGDDLDLSDEEDAAARRRESKRREFARMRRELLKDEAVGKIAEDKKKLAFLRSIEDREAAEEEDDEDNLEEIEAVGSSEDQHQPHKEAVIIAASQEESQPGWSGERPFHSTTGSKLNRQPLAPRRIDPTIHRKPATLAEIRDSVSFLIEEPDSQLAMVDLGLSDSEEDPEAYVDLDRHFRDAEADENQHEDDHDDLGDFIVDDELPARQDCQESLFKKPDLPCQERASYTERRTKHGDVVDRLSLLRQASSSASSTTSAAGSTKMAFISSKGGASFSGVPTLLRRATTASSLGSRSGRENVSATGVVTNKTERGSAGDEKDFVRKGSGGRRNAVNYQAERKTLREEKMSARAGIVKSTKGKQRRGFLGGLFRDDSWE